MPSLADLMQVELNAAFWHLAERLMIAAPRHVRIATDGWDVYIWTVQVHRFADDRCPALIFGDTGTIPGMWPHAWPAVEDAGRTWGYDTPELTRVPLAAGPEALIAAYDTACARPDPLDQISAEHLIAMGARP